MDNFTEKMFKNIIYRDNDELFSNNILHKPIGIGNKSYGFMEAMLHRNIGSHHHSYDGFGTTIGMFANPYFNSEINPWFMVDESKKRYDNYISYVNDMYYHGSMPPPIFKTIKEKDGTLVSEFMDYSGLYEEYSRVGVVHQYDINNIIGAKMFIPNGSTNPNGYDDTRLGVINNFYLNSTLQNANNFLLTRSTSSYHLPSYGYDEQTVANSFSVTQGAYAKFGFTGQYGINNGTLGFMEGSVMPQNLLTDDIIPWSTVDSKYNSEGNIDRLQAIMGGNSDAIKNNSSFGNFYDLTYSMGLLSASGGKTQEFIAKSIYGIDLLSNHIPSLEYDAVDANTWRNMSGKKYFALIGSRNTNYIDAMADVNILYEKQDGNIIRMTLMSPGNDNLSSFNTYLMYTERDGYKSPKVFYTSEEGNSGTYISRYQSYSISTITKKDIISYTNEQFKNNKFKTIIGKFHTDVHGNDKDMTSTAVSQFGMSRGRNLLKKDYKNSLTNDFHDPYCRVWTYHKQYKKYSDLIRPFKGDEKEILDTLLTNKYQNRRDRLEYSVKNPNNGLVNCGPTSMENYKKCMFSIENLAWKGSTMFEKGEYAKGPHGGRIMWFPPYGLTFNENVNTQWNATQFIGRGEKIFSYVDTERSGNLSFELLIDHPSILNNVANIGSDTCGNVDDVDSKEQEILRFFAGCDIFTDEKPQVEEKEESEVMPEIILEGTNIKEYAIGFNVFFPSGYSGEGDDDEWCDVLIDGLTNTEDDDQYVSLNALEGDSNDENIYMVSFEEFCDYMKPSNSVETYITKTIKKLFNNYSITTINIDVCCEYVDDRVAPARLRRIKTWLQSNSIFKNVDIKHEYVMDMRGVEDKENKEMDIYAYDQVKVKIQLRKEWFQINKESYDSLGNVVSKNPYEEPLTNMTHIVMNNMKEIQRHIQPKQQENVKARVKMCNEYEFFQEIDRENPFLRNRILSKIKYFDPAYHSISPEGFNNRLTFLHQCTRQGGTNSVSDGVNNVRNLSFGAPPICILRVGDFFYTKIIIESLTISYDQTFWDLNDEGIGVMPMLAKVDMSFKFIGGSELGGAIDYLQNAVSFNYYANTSVFEKNAKIKDNENVNNKTNENTQQV